MKGTLTVVCAGLAFSWVAVAGAQTGYGGQTSSSQSESKHSKMSREVTVTGCLEQGSTPNTFVLRNATHEEGSSSGMSSSSGSSGSTQGTSGSSSGQTGSSMSGQSPMDFQLVAGRGKDLKKYVGQRVQVKGTVEPMEEGGHSGMSSQSGSGTGEASGMSGSQGTTGSQSGQGMSAGPITHRLKVSSVKQLGSSCQ